MKRVLVTGPTGFIGRNCLGLLTDRGFEVHAAAHSLPNAPLGRSAHWYSVDLLDRCAVAKLFDSIRPSHLLHFAWYTDPKDYRSSPMNLAWCEAGINLVQRFAESGGSRAVFAGTCFEYDSQFGYFSESVTPEAPSTLYGVCKNSLQRVVTAYAGQIGLSVAWGRIFYLYGPYEARQRLVPSVILALLRGETARCTHGRQLRDFLEVSDVADAFVALLDGDTQGVVNVGSGEPVTIRVLVSRIASLLRAERLVEFGAIEAAASDPPCVIADVRRLRDEVQWVPRYSLEEGLTAAIHWWEPSVRSLAVQDNG